MQMECNTQFFVKSFTVSKTKCVDGDMIIFIFGLFQKFQIRCMKL